MRSSKLMMVRAAMATVALPAMAWPALAGAQAGAQDGAQAGAEQAGRAQAGSERITLPALPMAEALRRIGAAGGRAVRFDPDAVAGLTSNPVARARDADAAVRQAIRGLPLGVVREPGGALVIVNDIVVQARRDEAETNLLVREATTSTRSGETLRDQPRNSQVISSRLIREQQSLTVTDALRNAGGVTVNNTTIQGGAEYSVRGFGANGAVNGLPVPTGPGGVAIGATQPVANIERLEVLKGPDALLLGQDNLGGVVNIVTKKPSVEPLLSLDAQTGSFGLRRMVLDANRGLDEGRKWSARVIASAGKADRNWGGYRGDEDYLFAPSLRYKDGSTDVIVGLSTGLQRSGTSPYAVLNPATGDFYDIPRNRPVIGGRDQGLRVSTTQYFGEVTTKPTTWLTLVGRAQHSELGLEIAQYSPFGVVDPAGVMFAGSSRLGQRGNSDALDGYARAEFATGPVTHKITAGYTYVSNENEQTSTGINDISYNFITRTQALPDLSLGTLRRTATQDSEQNGIYGQYLVKAWRLSLIAGVRNNRFNSAATNYYFSTPTVNRQRDNFTIPNFGAVLDVTDDLALFASLAYGYVANAQVDRNNERLPNIETRNLEAGVKLDLFGDRALINASWFQTRQSNLTIPDPAEPIYLIAVPGQQATGIDLNLTGELLRGWQVMGSFTRTQYRPLTPTEYVRVTTGQPRDQYSLYSSYHHKVGDAKLGLGGGLFGRSSAVIDSLGQYRSPAARQVDLNGLFELGPVNATIGVRNLFDRVNYGTTFTTAYVPISEPRTWRLTIGYRFQ